MTSEPTSEMAQICPVPLSISIQRSSQLDAWRLDSEITQLLQDQLTRVLAPLGQVEASTWGAELTAVMMTLVYALSVGLGSASPGSTLLNLRYRDERAPASQVPGRTGMEGPELSPPQRAALVLGAGAAPYLWLRASAALLQHYGTRGRNSSPRLSWVAPCVRGVDATLALAHAVNSCVFLWDGKYRSVLERLLRARLVYAHPVMSRAVSFDYLNRTLLWSQVSEVLLVLLPALSSGVMGRALGVLGAKLRRMAGLQAGGKVGKTGSGDGSSPAPVCPLCSTPDILNPFAAVPCGHVFCYYCLHSHCRASASFQCPHDGIRVAALRRWRRKG